MEEKTFLDKLNEYFKNTPIEKVKQDWNKSRNFDKIGLTVEQYLSSYSWSCEEEYEKCNSEIICAAKTADNKCKVIQWCKYKNKSNE